MENLSVSELIILYNNFVTYRDKYCNGWAKMNVKDFYAKYGLKEYIHPHDEFDLTLKEGDYPYGTFGGY